MTILESFGLIGTLASIAGLLYGIYYARANRRVKSLLYDTSLPVPLATAQSPEDAYSLSVVFCRKGEIEERISSAHVQFLRFANLGRESIRRTDIAPSNPLRVYVQGARTLDISLSSASRAVNCVTASGVELTDHSAYVDITFDFLDFQDGGVVKVLTEGGRAKIRLVGDIIGMPEGIRQCNEVQSIGLFNIIGFAFGCLFQIAALVLAILAYNWITGSWTHVWVLALPFVAIILPGIIIAIIASTIWPDQKIRLPSSLGFPKWFQELRVNQMLGLPRSRESLGEGNLSDVVKNLEGRDQKDNAPNGGPAMPVGNSDAPGMRRHE